MIIALVVGIVIGIILIGFLIFIHEAGHFFVAKFFKVKVEEFGFGYPPRIWGKRRGETIYSINAIPAGGFVRLLGEDQENVKDPRSLAAKGPWLRTAIITAGIAMNLLVAFVLFTVVLVSSGFRVDMPTTLPTTGQTLNLSFPFGQQTQGVMVDYVVSRLSAEKGGIKPLDEVVSANGQSFASISTFQEFVEEREGEGISLELYNIFDHNTRQLVVTPIGLQANRVLIGYVDPGSPADKAGMKPLDEVVSVNGRSFSSTVAFTKFIKENAGRQTSFELYNVADGTTRQLVVVPREKPPKGEGPLGVSTHDFSDGNQALYLTYSNNVELVYLSKVATVRYGSLPDKIFIGPLHSANMIYFQGAAIGSLISTSFKEKSIAPVSETVAGPVGLVGILGQFIGSTGLSGTMVLIDTIALISLVLGVVNLLPIPAADGGRLFFTLLEAIFRIKVNEKIERAVHTVGFTVLILLFILITYNDIVKFFR